MKDALKTMKTVASNISTLERLMKEDEVQKPVIKEKTKITK